MATPKGVPAVSTPNKNPHISTPNRPTASPKPVAGSFANKSLAYKSPAVRTPSSLQGHSHGVSISSQPTATPLAAPAIHDELLNLNSPAAALIASIGQTGLTPIANGPDGLGLAAAAAAASNPIKVVSSVVKTPEAEKLARLEQVAKFLRTKIAGRGLTREGVERIAQIQGFTILWDEANLNIAGNSVDLEIVFDNQDRDSVLDVQLRLNTAGSDEPQLQEDASDIVKRHLQVGNESLAGPDLWQSLEPFSRDLGYLSQLDHLDSSVNGFELLDDLYATFCKIWNAEAKRLEGRPGVHHACLSNIGKPHKNYKDSLGMTTEFWFDKHVCQASPNEALGPPATTVLQGAPWTAKFSCEKSAIGIELGKAWLEAEPLQTTLTTEDVFKEDQIERPNWSVPGIAKTLDEQQRKDAEAMMDGGHETRSLHNSLNLVFTCHFDRAVILPLNVATELNSQHATVQIDHATLAYQQSLLNASFPAKHREWNPNLRWARSISSFDRLGRSECRLHVYSLFANGIPWSCSVTSLHFSHPKQYAETIPTFRQYALLWTVLRNTLGDEVDAEPMASDSATASIQWQTHPSSAKVKRRSNKRQTQDEPGVILLSSQLPETHTMRIDMSLDVLTDSSKVKLDVIIPKPNDVMMRDQGTSFVHVTIEIRKNGIIDIPVLRGVHSENAEKLKRKATKVLSLSENISVLAEWLLQQLRP